ncbi:MAG: phenylacetate-CoA oxygenase, PaaJ subunit, partial [Humibacillus sp.]|nr:phenylacetate-CoA oxygenase, PaaJ subunit [Humibacillus sp.]
MRVIDIDTPVAEAISQIPDPEVPVISIADLGILRGVEVDEEAHTVAVTITPTYSGCPAMEAIASRIVFEADRRGYAASVRTLLSPAWTTDWMSEEGRAALVRFCIAPPGPASGGSGQPGGPVSVTLSRHVVACPQCGSMHTS